MDVNIAARARSSLHAANAYGSQVISLAYQLHDAVAGSGMYVMIVGMLMSPFPLGGPLWS
jgi:hypothetical protein